LSINIYSVVVAAIFSGFVLLDVLSVLPRIAGSIVGLQGLSYSFQVMVMTLKRVFVVLYPPFLGFIVITGGLGDLFSAIFLSYIASAFALALYVVFYKPILSFFCDFIFAFNSGRGLAKSFFGSLFSKRGWEQEVKEKISILGGHEIDLKIFVSALWIYFFYSGSMFFINVVSAIFSEYSEVILQTAGFFNALGTVALAFYLDPKISRIYETGRGLNKVLRSLVFAHISNLIVVSPLFFGVFYFLAQEIV